MWGRGTNRRFEKASESLAGLTEVINISLLKAVSEN